MNVTEIFITHRITYLKGTDMTAYVSGRRFSGFVLALSGKIDYVLTEGGKISLREGEIMYLPEMSGYSAHTPECEFEHCTLNFGLSPSPDTTLSEKTLSVMFGTRPVVVKPDSFEEAKRLCERVISSRRSNTEGSELLCRAYLYELLHMFVTALEREDYGGVRRTVMPAKRYIDAHYLENIPASVLAAECAMSETHFRRRFRQAFGTAPGEYIAELRISRAKELLLTRLYRVSEVAEMSGYSDANYFARLFKSKVGMTPVEFTESR